MSGSGRNFSHLAPSAAGGPRCHDKRTLLLIDRPRFPASRFVSNAKTEQLDVAAAGFGSAYGLGRWLDLALHGDQRLLVAIPASPALRFRLVITRDHHGPVG